MDQERSGAEPALAAWFESEQAGWLQIENLIGQLAPEQAVVTGYLPGWSVKDLLAHLAGWFAVAGMELERVDAGSRGFDENVDERNKVFVEANRDQPFTVVLGEAITARNRMLQELRALGHIPDRARDAVHKAGPDHYREHIDRLQDWVEELHSRHPRGSVHPVRRHDFFPHGNAPDPHYAGKLK
jgi:hypothetical protein